MKSRRGPTPRRKQEVGASIHRTRFGAGAHLLVNEAGPLMGIGFEYREQFRITE